MELITLMIDVFDCERNVDLDWMFGYLRGETLFGSWHQSWQLILARRQKNYLGPTILCCTSMIFCTCLFGSVISPQTVIIHESNLHDTFDQMSILPGKIFQLFWYFTLMPKFLAKSLFSSRCVVHHFCIPKNILSWRTWRRETFSWTRSGFCSKVKTIYLGPSTTRLALWRYFLGLA